MCAYKLHKHVTCTRYSRTCMLTYHRVCATYVCMCVNVKFRLSFITCECNRRQSFKIHWLFVTNTLRKLNDGIKADTGLRTFFIQLQFIVNERTVFVWDFNVSVLFFYKLSHILQVLLRKRIFEQEIYL